MSVMMTVPTRAPAAAGVKVIEIVQLAPALTLEPQLSLSVNSVLLGPETPRLLIARVPPPLLVSVVVFAALVVPTT